ncbi:MAG: polysaccharide biosynthesis/export family protein, partial [Verrucomicrobiales bacterium]
MRSLLLNFLLSAGIVLIAGCKTKGPGFDPYSSTSPDRFSQVQLDNQLNPSWLHSPTNFYTLGPGDIIQIEIIGEAQSRAQTVVGPDGKIYYSILPGLSVWGLTLSESKAAVE